MGGSLIEEVSSLKPGRRLGDVSMGCAPPRPITELESTGAMRLTSGISELDRVLGGGGSSPRVSRVNRRRSRHRQVTLLLQVSGAVSRDVHVLYVSGEESSNQVKLRADRLGFTLTIYWLCLRWTWKELSTGFEMISPALLS